jgi:hypothetical protein
MDFFEEIKIHIRDFLYLVPQASVYINIVRYTNPTQIEEGKKIAEDCKKNIPNCKVLFSPNEGNYSIPILPFKRVGCDIGGYFFMLRKMYEDNDVFDYFIFMHSKSKSLG